MGRGHGDEERVCSLWFYHRPTLGIAQQPESDGDEGRGNSLLFALMEAHCMACGQSSEAQGQVCDIH